VPDEAHNALPENANSENIYISGDNLDGLKHLLKSYAGKVKCIYIDPPYNTGTALSTTIRLLLPRKSWPPN
jgi:16S rRNA G966 N2-methylase RsmD